MTTNSSVNFTGVDSLCNRVMVGVANMIKGRNIDAGRACEIMREEIKAFFFGEQYADERDCIMRGSLSDQTIILSIITRCVERILI